MTLYVYIDCVKALYIPAEAWVVSLPIGMKLFTHDVHAVNLKKHVLIMSNLMSSFFYLEMTLSISCMLSISSIIIFFLSSILPFYFILLWTSGLSFFSLFIVAYIVKMYLE